MAHSEERCQVAAGAGDDQQKQQRKQEQPAPGTLRDMGNQQQEQGGKASEPEGAAPSKPPDAAPRPGSAGAEPAAAAAAAGAQQPPVAGGGEEAAGAGGLDVGPLCDLSEAACTPGTPEFQAAAAANAAALERYRDRTKHHISLKRAKPDMIAYKELRKELTAPERHGHVPGVAVGEKFLGRGELAILGLHTQMMRGIMSLKGRPAYAIAMSGGYKDDQDTGATFWYTGQGGQEKSKQVKDQSYEAPDNAALVANCDTRTPVRVFRGTVGGGGERLYAYEGLYRVAAHKREPSKDGPTVIRFQLVGVPGHSGVSGTVSFKCLNRSVFQSVLLARQPDGRKRGRSSAPQRRSREELEASIRVRALSGRHGRLVCADLANGLEKVPIPVWNALDQNDRIVVMHQQAAGGQQQQQQQQKGQEQKGQEQQGQEQQGQEQDGEEEVPQFEYINDYKFGEEAAKQLAVQAEEHFADKCRFDCGLEYSRGAGGSGGAGGRANYTADGLLLCTQPCGVMECDPGCGTCKECKRNRVVSEGLRYPLEVFKVSPSKGWGVRCAEALPVGAVVCCYIGLVVTDEIADDLRNRDQYLFDLNHFHLLQRSAKGALGGGAEEDGGLVLNPNMPWLPKELLAKHLTIDANQQGNIGRFINHSCDPNCIVQTVFAGNARSQLLYYITIVAMQDIPPFTELTYDYGYSNEEASERGEAAALRIPCTCGAPNCKGQLM